MDTEECKFCEQAYLDMDTFYEDDLWRAMWDMSPVTPGHAMVIPKRHVQYLEELNEEELSTMMSTATHAMKIIRDADLDVLYESMLLAASTKSRPFLERALANLLARSDSKCEFNLGINDGPIAGQSVPHLHLHIMPRYEGDSENPRGGVRNILANDEYSNRGEEIT